MDLEAISGPTVANTLVSGLRMTCTAMASTYMQTMSDTMDNSSMTKSKVTESTHGPMAVNTKVGGIEANSMESGPITIAKRVP